MRSMGTSETCQIMKPTMDQSWNALFSSLAFAEKAAANECLKVAQRFRAEGLDSLADEYVRLAIDENRHHELAKSITRNIVPLTDSARNVYNGGFFSPSAPIIERLMSVHFVFEPSALAFLGYIASHTNELICDEAWAEQIKAAFKEILYDEVGHVSGGEELIQKIWARSTMEERGLALRTMRKHRAFLKAGLLSFFSKDSEHRPAILKMLQRFDFYFERSMKGVLNAESTQIAS